MEKYIGSLKTTKTFPDYNKLEIQQEVDSILKLNASMGEKLNQIEDMNENDPIAISILIDDLKIERK